MAFEYVLKGSFDIYQDLSAFESTQILCQAFSALKYLHNRNPSIGHRDIKPGLIIEREINNIYVESADFGVSKAADALKTFCGSLE